MGERRTIHRSLNTGRLGALLAGLAFLATMATAALTGDGHRSMRDCPPITARFDSADGGAIAVRVCALMPLPLVGEGLLVRYDLQIRIGWLTSVQPEPRTW